MSAAQWTNTSTNGVVSTTWVCGINIAVHRNISKKGHSHVKSLMNALPEPPKLEPHVFDTPDPLYLIWRSMCALKNIPLFLAGRGGGVYSISCVAVSV